MAYYESKDPETGKSPKHRAAALGARIKGNGLSNAEIKPNKDKERYEGFEDDHDLEEKDAKIIEAEVGSKITEIENRDWGEGNYVKEYTFENEDEWLVFENEEEAEDMAIFRVEEDIDENPEWFSPETLMEHVNAVNAEHLFREMYDEQNTGYVDDIESEDNEEYTNRLANEMYERNIITYEEATDKDFNLENQKETMVEQMTDESSDEGNYGFTYYKDNFGDESAHTLLKNWDLVDTREFAEYLVSSNGIANTLSGYDGMQVDLDNKMVMYRSS